MPKLPSGRQVGVSFSGLSELIQSAQAGTRVREFLSIRCPEDLRPYMRLVLFQHGDQSFEPVNSVSGDLADGLQPVRTDLAVDDVLGSDSDWTALDRVAFEKFIQSEPIQEQANRMFTRVASLQLQLTKNR